MAKVTARKETGKLVIDFTFRGVRCREQTALEDLPANRKRVQALVDKLLKAQKEGTFNYRDFFPQSALASRFDPVQTIEPQQPRLASEDSPSEPAIPTPPFSTFALQWVEEHKIEWRRSHLRSLMSTLNGRLIPHFKEKAVSQITKSDILTFRATLAKVKGRGDKEGLSPKRINEIIGTLGQIMDEAADRFEFTSPTTGVKRLRVRKTDVDPFSLADVQSILATVRSDYRDYFTTRFFTSMRTGEVHGLKWRYVDFERRLILVRETFVLGEDEYTKTDGSQRDIQMSQPVFDALLRQREATGKLSDYVFCNMAGQPLDNKNFSDRVWYPLLRHLGLTERRPYQMRHTAATLWLASGEAPEWIARQLGHTSTEMLFRVYSRYVPNLTRQDGSAMERLLASRLATGKVLRMDDAHLQQVGDSNLFAEAGGSEPAPMPVPKPRGFAQAGISRTRASWSRTPQDITLPEGHAGEDPQPPPWGAMHAHATQLNPLHA